MARVRALRGIRYNADHVRLGGVLAPPYDVISPAQLEALYGRNLRNVVRVDYGMTYDDDVPGENDRYTRAREFLDSWLSLGILTEDAAPALYIADQEFTAPGGGTAHRRGLLAVVPARPWDAGELLPHERTLSAAKEDRLALLRATRTQTSPVFAMWSGAAGIEEPLRAVTAGPPLLGGRTDGEMGSEKHLLWRVDDPATIAAIQESLAGARLYVADGHHRYETAVAYAQERRGAEPSAPADAPFEHCLVCLAAADDPALVILPTHRLVRPGPGLAFSIDDLWARLDDRWELEAAPDMEAALDACARARPTHHAFAAAAHDGVAVLRRQREKAASPRDGLDAVVLEREVLEPAGVSAAAIREGALAYTRDAAELEAAVRRRDAVLGFGLQPVTTAEVVAVADAGETMPQKSTYFYPKVPTGLVLYPV